MEDDSILSQLAHSSDWVQFSQGTEAPLRRWAERLYTQEDIDEAFAQWHVALTRMAPVPWRQRTLTPDELLYKRQAYILLMVGHGLGRIGAPPLAIVDAEWFDPTKPAPFSKVLVDKTDRLHFLTWAYCASHAVPYLWQREMWNVAAGLLGEYSERLLLPPHRFEMATLPHSFMWWTTPDGIPVSAVGHRDAEAINCATLVTPAFGHLSLTDLLFVREGNTPLFLIQEQLLTKDQESYPEDYVEQDYRNQYESFARALAFINSPFVQAPSRQASRALRRRSAIPRSAPNWEPRFIQLRRRELPPSTDTGGSRHVDWQFQWIVSGHFRNQWYPSTQGHMLIWIEPYVKGPEDKPLKPRTYNVLR